MSTTENPQNAILKKLAGDVPIEPKGWFRWMHDHYLGRYGVRKGYMFEDSPYFAEWLQLSDNPEPLHQVINVQDLLISFLNCHAWTAGVCGLFKTVFHCWDQLSRTSRGYFFAGITEQHAFDSIFNAIIKSIPMMDLTPDSLCQLACNAVKNNRLDLLELLLTDSVDLTSEIRRFDASDPQRDWISDELKNLSHRVIDMILEAALIQNKPAAARLALAHGANPNIPVWQLERSSNKRYSTLGYVIDSEFQQNNEPHREMAELLLEHGASPVGIPYAGMDSELYLAIEKGWDDFAKRLISMGAQLTKSTAPEESSEAGRVSGSE